MEFTISTSVPATPELVYETWLNNKGHTAMTGGEANINNIVGGKFDAWNGYIWGTNLELEPGKRIVQSWRTTEFNDEEEDSKIKIIFESDDEGTILTLTHTNLPEHGEQYIQGWEDHYFTPMKAYFEAL